MDDSCDSVDNLGTDGPDTPNGYLTARVGMVTYPVPMTDQRPPRRLLRPIEVRRLLGVGRTTVHDHTVSGRLEAETTPGGHRRYPADQAALRDRLAAQETGQ